MHARNCFPLILLICSSLMFAQSTQSSTDKGSMAKGSGCVEAGVEAGCIVLHDLHSGTNFNLFFKDNPPKLGTAIEFEGTANNNPNTCMQGKPVDVSKWNPIRMECQQSKTSESKPPECKDWSAWYDVQPAGPKTLHIQGTCTFIVGTKAELVPRTPPGFNPQIYIVDLVITRPKGTTSRAEAPLKVHYSEKTDHQYDSVDIEPDHVNVPVRIIH